MMRPDSAQPRDRRPLREGQTSMEARGVGVKRPVSKSVARRRREVVANYMSSQVDPLMHEVIRHLLVTQPEKPREAMIEFLRQVKNNTVCPTESSRKVSRKDRIYMVTEISPIITQLLADLVSARPKIPIDYMIAWLSKKPSLRSKLQEAQKLDASVLMKEEEKDTSSSSSQANIQTKCILSLGHTGAGKTTTILGLSGNMKKNIRSTTGFRRYTLAHVDEKSGKPDGTSLAFFDLGGKEKAYRGWVSYYHEAHAILFTVDSCANLQEARTAFDFCFRPDKDALSQDPRRAMAIGKPLLVLANKQDCEHAASAEEIAAALDLESYQKQCADSQEHIAHVAVCPCVGLVPLSEDENDNTKATVDQHLTQALDWLAKCVDDNGRYLTRRLENETDRVAKIDAEKADRKEKRVFRKTLRKAFPTDPEEKPGECFEPSEGIEFFAAELGVSELEEPAAELAELVNYQKLALSMMGNMHCPINKKKRKPMDWPAIRSYVNDRLNEAFNPEVIAQDELEDAGVSSVRRKQSATAT